VIGLLVALLAGLIAARRNDPPAPLPSLGWGLLTFFGTFFVLSLLEASSSALGDHVRRIDSRQPGRLSVILGGSAFFALLIAWPGHWLPVLPGGELPGRALDFAAHQPGPDRKAHWALLLGIVILVVLTAIPILGGLIKVAVVLVGPGAIVILLSGTLPPHPGSHCTRR
jgi:hypothetical protein